MTRASAESEWDNEPLIGDILRLRQELSTLLGYDNYGEVSVATKMASNVDEVNSLIEELRARCYPTAQAEFAALQEYALGHGHPGAELRQWDVPFWAERHK